MNQRAALCLCFALLLPPASGEERISREESTRWICEMAKQGRVFPRDNPDSTLFELSEKSKARMMRDCKLLIEKEIGDKPKPQSPAPAPKRYRT